MKVVLDRKAFEFNWSVAECNMVIYVREILYKVTHEVTIQKNGADWLAKNLQDTTDHSCRGHVLEGRPRWVDSMATLELKTDNNDTGYYIKAEVCYPSDNWAVCMSFPEKSSCRGWCEVGETLFTFISGHNVKKEGKANLRQSGASGGKAGEICLRGIGGSKSLVGEPELELSLRHIQGDTKLVLDTPFSMAEWKKALEFTLSDDCEGCAWLMEAVKDEFLLTVEPKFKLFSAIKAVVQITDKQVRQRMLDLGVFEVGGVSDIISEWDPCANTLSEDWFHKKKRRLNILRLPFHLWSEDKITTIGSALGKVIKIHEDTISLEKLECGKLLIEVKDPQMNFNEIELCEGDLIYKLKIFPETVPNNTGKPWKVLHALQKDRLHRVDKDVRPKLDTDGVVVPDAVNEIDLFPGKSKTAGIFRQTNESRDPTTRINEMGQTLDLSVGQGVDDLQNRGARKEAGQADLDQNI